MRAVVIYAIGDRGALDNPSRRRLEPVGVGEITSETSDAIYALARLDTAIEALTELAGVAQDSGCLTFRRLIHDALAMSLLAQVTVRQHIALKGEH